MHHWLRPYSPLKPRGALCIVRYALCIFASLALGVALSSCNKQQARGDNGAFAPAKGDATTGYDLDAIAQSGELIVATLSGPDTYYDYHGEPMGLQYALAADFAHREGLSLRVEVARDTTELLKMLTTGDADIIALPLPTSLVTSKGLQAAGIADSAKAASWAVRSESKELAEVLQAWAATNPTVTVAKKERERVSESRRVRRQVRAAYLSKEKGIISTYDSHFREAATKTGWDWRLIAAQCYQESGFDPSAVSGAGARGLMQIMPSTARGLGVDPEQLYSPEVSIATAATYIARLNSQFTDIRDREERVKFVLAAYNGGSGHVRDAMALAQKYGRNASRWDDVRPYVLHLSEARYYRDPVVRHGYMIGSETANYVTSVLERYRAYGGSVASTGAVNSGSEVPTGARPAHKRNRYSKEQKILTPDELQQRQ